MTDTRDELIKAGMTTPTEQDVANVEALADQPVDHRAAAEHWLTQAEAERTAGHRDPLSAQIATAHALLADRSPTTLVIEHADTIVTNAGAEATLRTAATIAAELRKAGL